MIDRQCPSCGGICKPSGCERRNVEKQRKTIIGRPALVKFSDHPDSVGGMAWSRLEMDWIDARDRMWGALLDAAINEYKEPRNDR